MNEKRFKELEIELEKAITRLNKMQDIHSKQTGKNFVMPVYLKTPEYLENLKIFVDIKPAEFYYWGI